MPETQLNVQEEIKKLLQENQELLKENNVMLHKIRRDAMWAMVFRLMWVAMIVGVPIAVYYFVLEPNVSNLQNAFNIMIQGAKDVSGLRDVFDGIPQR